jgi:catechol 2,3-dioxygenase-like lactoylglutathione lyase family enzyme
MYITGLATQVRVANLERALRFYTETLGFVEESRFRDIYASVRAGGTSLHLKQVETIDPSIAFVKEGDHMHLYLRVIDLEETFRELEGKVELVHPITTKPSGDREFTIRDPDGHTIYLGEDDAEPRSR